MKRHGREKKAYKILVVDDDKGLVKLIQKTLEREGFETEGVLNGTEAVARIVNAPPSLMLLDYRLSDMTGRQVVEAFTERNKPVPFIIMTGQGDEEIAVNMMKLGARDYLVKDTAFIDLLPSVVQQTVSGIEREIRLAKAEEERSRLLQRLNVQWKMARMIDANQNTLCDFVLEEIVKMTDSRYGFYGFLNEDQSVLIIHSWSIDTMKDCDIHDKPLEFPIEKSGVWGNAIRERKTLIINDMKKDYPNKKGLPEGHVEINRILTVPVFRDNRIVAVGAVANKAKNYTEADAKGMNEFMHSAQLMQDRIALEGALRDSEQRFRELFMSIKSGVAVYEAVDEGEDFIFKDFNRTAEKIEKIKKQDLLGRKVTEVFPGVKAFGLHDVLKRVWKSGNPEHHPVSIYMDGRIEGWRENYVYRLPTDEIVAVYDDVTEKKKAAEKLEQVVEELARSNTELERFAYIASHDLKEPLRTISSFATLLQQRYKDKLDKDAGEFINFIVDGSNRMEQLIDDLLTYSRVSTSRNFEPVDCNKILVRAISNLTVLIEENGAKITFDPLPTLMADGMQLELLFQNLINNGIKFHGEEPPHVHISAAQEKKEWVFSVADNGIGIDPRDRDRIFNIFQRLHGRSDYSGTGIGLAICKKIADLHGGMIRVESDSGNGAVFYFTIPERRE